jgi:HNH endonuclease
MQEFFSFRNFRQFERTRTEIKLPYDLLNNLDFRQLPDAHKAHLICLLLLSARRNNLLPNCPAKLERLIGATEPLDLNAFVEFLDVATVEAPIWQDRVDNRHVPDGIRATVLVRDGGRCRKCRRAINLEMDHIVPVSKGGKTEEANLQTLCRRCNRAKSKKLVPGF